MEMTTALPDSLDLSAAPLRGRAIGALICGIFGAVWMFEALYFGAIATPACLTVIGLFAAAFVIWPTTQLLSLRHAAFSSAAGQQWSDVSKAYWITVTIEGLACMVAGNVLNNIGRSDLVPEAIGVIVGLHFLPLAKIFRARIYNWTGVAMVLGVLASLAVPVGSFRNIVACGASGLALWATAAVICVRIRLSSK
jgi:hypothetical protein